MDNPPQSKCNANDKDGNNGCQTNNQLQNDIAYLEELRTLWDLINYDINFWIEIAKKKADEDSDSKESWNMLGDMLWKLAPTVESQMVNIENLSAKLKNPIEETSQPTQKLPKEEQLGREEEVIEDFYKQSGRTIMQIALTIKITDTLKLITKSNKSKQEIENLINNINCPLNSEGFEPPLQIIEREKKFRSL